MEAFQVVGEVTFYDGGKGNATLHTDTVSALPIFETRDDAVGYLSWLHKEMEMDISKCSIKRVEIIG